MWLIFYDSSSAATNHRRILNVLVRIRYFCDLSSMLISKYMVQSWIWEEPSVQVKLCVCSYSIQVDIDFIIILIHTFHRSISRLLEPNNKSVRFEEWKLLDSCSVTMAEQHLPDTHSVYYKYLDQRSCFILLVKRSTLHLNCRSQASQMSRSDWIQKEAWLGWSPCRSPIVHRYTWN